MDWEAKEKERKEAEQAKRKMYLDMPEVQSLSLPSHERYEWIRYHREKEAAEWLERERRKIPAPIKEERKQRKPSSRRVVQFKSWHD